MLIQKLFNHIRLVACAAIFAGSFQVSSDAQASGSGSATAGHALAQQRCARCHTIDGLTPSPVAEAPPFTRIARQWPPDHLREAFAEGVMVGHGPVEMPTFELEPDTIDDLVAYLNSLTSD